MMRIYRAGKILIKFINGVLQLLAYSLVSYARSRFWLLKNGGVTNLDKGEAEEAKAIRDSRQNCGCNCKGIKHDDKEYVLI